MIFKTCTLIMNDFIVNSFSSDMICHVRAVCCCRFVVSVATDYFCFFFPNKVRIHIRKVCRALEGDALMHVLHHYDGPKF